MRFKKNILNKIKNLKNHLKKKEIKRKKNICFFAKKNISLFLIIRNTQFDKISPVQSNPKRKKEKKSKNKNPFLSKNKKISKMFFFAKKSAILLVLQTKEISF